MSYCLSVWKHIRSRLVHGGKTVALFTGMLMACLASYAQNITRPNITGPSGLQVNSYTGSLFYQRSDLVIPGLGFSVDIRFSYNSADRGTDQGFGYGWTFMYNRSYSTDSAGITMHNGDGRRDAYPLKQQFYLRPAGVFDVLTEYGPGKFKLLSKDRTEYFFDDASHKKITRIKDRNGNELKFSYAGGRLIAITDASNRMITFTWTNNRLSSIKADFASPARTINYTYNSSGCLTAVKNANGYTTTYAYGPGRAMSAVTDFNGNKADIVYNGNKAVSKLVSCQAEKSISYNVSQHKTYVVEKSGDKNIVTVFEFDEAGKLINKEGNCCGFKTNYQYDADNNLNRVTNANGQVTLYTYDDVGNLVAMTDPLGKVMRYTYETSFNHISSVTDKNGNKTTMAYDNRGNLVSVTNALFQTMQYTYDEKGNRTTYRDLIGNLTRYSYDQYGYATTVTDAAGGVTRFTYDAWGNTLTLTDANNHTSSYVYDAVNRLLSATDALGGKTQYTYDGNGNRLSLTDANNNTTEYTYDAHNNLLQVKDASGHSTFMSYDAMDNLVSLTDANGKKMAYVYDNLSRLISETNAAGETKVYTYDGNGNRLSTRYPNGNTLYMLYDALNRVTGMTDQQGFIASYTHDANGNRLSQTDGKGNSKTYKYDVLNRLAVTIDASGNSTVYTYDANGNLLKETDRNGNATVYTYDALDRRLTTTDALGYITVNSYDAADNLLSVKDAKGNTTSYKYDALDRNIEELFADNTRKQYVFDAVGNLVKRTDNRGQVTNYTYDKLNRPVVRSYPSYTDSLSYDATGHLLSAVNQHARLQFTYDAADRLTSETLNGRTTGYTYHIAARIKKITYPGGRTVERVMDGRNQLVTINEGAGVMIAGFTYDAAGQNTGRTYANKTSANIGYNGNQKVTELNYNPGRFIDLGFSYDKEDNPVAAQFRHRTTNSEQYGYDKLNQLTQFGKAAGGQSSFNYDGVGNRTTAQVNGTTTTYAVNAMNAYSSIGAGSSVTPSYDGNGNLTSDGVHSYAYDAENRMVTVNGGATAQYLYDALGRRVKKMTVTDTIHYYYDGQQVIEERDEHDVVEATYVWGTWLDDIVSMQRDGQQYYYHTNAIGSVIAITNEVGNVLERYEYDAFGKATIYNNSYGVQAASAIGNTYMFSGRQHESETGLYFYRARYYDAVHGRFLQRDPLGYVDGMGLYMYVSNMPTKMIDPLGSKSIKDWYNSLPSFSFFDDMGKKLFSRWLEGSGATMTTMNGEWGEYMKKNELLKKQIKYQLEQHAMAEQKDKCTVGGDVDITFHAEIQNGYRTGYEMLHGTNKNVGDFKIKGTYTVKDGVLVYNVTLTWNDIIDPNGSYWTDDAAAGVLDIFNPKDYNVHISWQETYKIP